MHASAADPQLIQDLVDANRILADQGIVDAFGHVSARHDRHADRFLLARNLAPGQVSAADILEYEVDGSEPVQPDAPRGYLERPIHSEIYKARPDVMAVVHHHAPDVLPFCVVKGAVLRPACHMSGFLGSGPPLFEIRDVAGDASDLLIRNQALGAALARCLGPARVVLMRGHGCTVVGESVRVAIYRAVYTVVNARLLLQARALGEVIALTAAEAEATRITNEGQVDRPWNLWKERSQR
jgi:ribulose-5-phosphate 4-epimerase/fuculose-1-phosphate aldolase